MDDENASIQECTMNAESAVEIQIDDDGNLTSPDDGIGITYSEFIDIFSDVDSYSHSYPPSLNILG